MIHYPYILGPKLLLLAIIIVVLILLHGHLSPEQFMIAVIVSAIVFISLSAILWVIVLRALKKSDSKLARQTILFTEARSSEGFQAGPDVDKQLLGARGISLSHLRPAGTALVEGKRLSVVTEGDFIPLNSAIEVVEVRGSRVVVRRIVESPPG